MSISDAQVLTQRWLAEPYEPGPADANDATRYMSSPHEIMTADGNLHVAYVDGANLATHLVELHNRTFGDGQDAPQEPYPGFRAERENTPTLAANDTPGTVAPGWPEEHMLEAAMGLLASGYSVHDSDGWALARNRWMRAYHDMLDAHRDPDALFQQVIRENAAVNQRRRYLSDDLRIPRRSAVVQVDVTAKVALLVQELVEARVREFIEREPGKLYLEDKPEAWVTVLEKLGYAVFEPGTALTRDQVLSDSDLLRRTLKGRGYTVLHPMDGL